MEPVERVLDLFARHGGRRYVGEDVTLREHALQCAMLAEVADAPAEMIAAALLHDVGLLLVGEPAPDARSGGHDAAGAAFLAAHFAPAVAQVAALHVRARRMLAALDPGLIAQMTPAARARLAAQGGPLGPEERDRFLREPYADWALIVRRWDEHARIPGLRTPPLAHFRPMLEASLADRADAAFGLTTA